MPQPTEVASVPSLAASGNPLALAAEPNPPIEHGAVRRTLRLSIIEGLIAELYASCATGASAIAGTAVMTTWALYLGCSPFLVAVLGTLGYLAHAVQIPAAAFTAWLGHRGVCLVTMTLARLAHLPLIVLPFVDLAVDTKQHVLLGVAIVSSVMGVFAGNAWTAWMGEVVPGRVRGRYFGRRTALCTLGGVLAVVGAGELLDLGRAHDALGMALAGMALIACILGVVCSVLLARHHDPMRGAPRQLPDLRVALRPFQEPLARRVLAFQLAWNIAVGSAGGIWALYMIEHLQMSFRWVALQGVAVALVRVVTGPLWGHLLDRFGARPILVVCSFSIALPPLMWLGLRPDFLLPLAFEAVLSGVLWSGHNLATFALPLSLAPRQGRPFYLGAFGAAAGVAYGLAAALGGLLIDRVPAQMHLGGGSISSLHLLILISAVSRVAAATFALRLVEPGSEPVRVLFSWARARLLPSWL